jgi:hypothetical protein
MVRGGQAPTDDIAPVSRERICFGDARVARQAIGKIVLEMPRAALIDLRDTVQVRQVV